MKYLEKETLYRMENAERDAWAALGKYNFRMFHHYADACLKYNQLLEEPLQNPFKELAHFALGKAAVLESLRTEAKV